MRAQKKTFLYISSFLIVAFGQPAWAPALGIAAAAFGYALFWRALVDVPGIKKKFWIGAAWFASVQAVQLSWALSHPYSYIYAAYFVYLLGLGIQFGALSALITPVRLLQLKGAFAIAGLWTLLEWSRLFFLSGFTWNPAGLALAGSPYALQHAALFGAFGLTFWVILTNMLFLREWMHGFRISKMAVWLAVAAFPYSYGFWHLSVHSQEMARHPAAPLHAVLVQTAFPIEETLFFQSRGEMVEYVAGEWQKILEITKKHLGKKVDLIALPEFVVPFGAYTPVYSYAAVVDAFASIYGDATVAHLPAPQMPYAVFRDGVPYVNNAFWVQGIANCFDAGVVCGLEDCEECPERGRIYFSSAFYIPPKPEEFVPHRYDKRVLVPMGEYIPSSLCKGLCASYGITGSFTCGEEAEVWSAAGVPFGVSICYEETFGDLMRENRIKGAEMLVNLSSDVWYPNSRLPQQHLEHARLRTVEMGIPLLRACNTGVTGAVDSLGRNTALLGEDIEDAEWLADSLYVEVPTYHYRTLYASLGDSLVVGFSLLMALFLCGKKSCH